MGVSGCGKSSAGLSLEAHFGCPFIEGDSLHPAPNVRKMRSGRPLDDNDRWPWLEKVGSAIASQEELVLSCSPLKRSYRDRLRLLSGCALTFVYLKGSQLVLVGRMSSRAHDYMPLSLLESQLATLEEPTGEPDVVNVDIDQTFEEMIAEAIRGLKTVRDRTAREM